MLWGVLELVGLVLVEVVGLVLVEVAGHFSQGGLEDFMGFRSSSISNAVTIILITLQRA